LPVVHLCAEYWPFARTGGLAEAVRGIATYQAAAGRPTVVFMPYFETVQERFEEIEPVGGWRSIAIGGRVEDGRLHRFVGGDATSGVRVYFVEHPGYFNRPGLYGALGQDYPDNHRRFAFFCRFVLDVLGEIVPGPEVLHAHDWHTALAILYLRTVLHGTEVARNAATVLTVHNAGYQGHFDRKLLAELGLPDSLYDWRKLEWYDRVNVLKGGMAFSDMVTTVSPTHARELTTPDGGFGLHGAFQALGDRLVGIVNGIDQNVWNPAADPAIAAPYDRDRLEGKAVCKRWLQDALGVPSDPDIPLFGMAARLVEQKGFDLILASKVLPEARAQWVFIGEGDPRYRDALADLATRYPDRVAVRFAFTEEREHRLMAGADALLMPSQYEPCGLTQMRAQCYGTLPIVRRVGGLADTVEDDVTGFMFDAYSAEALDGALGRAIARHGEGDRWQTMMRTALDRDFSWPRRVVEYDRVYDRAIRGREGRYGP
jgi:starch synthase